MSIKWNGEGLPPVGTVCEFHQVLEGTSFGWQGPAEVEYYGTGLVVLKINEVSVVTENVCAKDFRPLRTKREKWIDKAVDAIGGKQAIINAEAVLRKLYDAGLAKDIDK